MRASPPLSTMTEKLYCTEGGAGAMGTTFFLRSVCVSVLDCEVTVEREGRSLELPPGLSGAWPPLLLEGASGLILSSST